MTSSPDKDEKNVPVHYEKNIESDGKSKIKGKRNIDERLKDNRKRKKESKEESSDSEHDGDGSLAVGPITKPDPYGGWKTVDHM